MITPASPWMGSTRKATVSGVIAASSAVASPNGTTRNPGVKEPKSSRAVGSVLKPTDSQGAAVKIVGADDDFSPVFRHALYLIAPFTRHLDCAFDRFGA